MDNAALQNPEGWHIQYHPFGVETQNTNRVL